MQMLSNKKTMRMAARTTYKEDPRMENRMTVVEKENKEDKEQGQLWTRRKQGRYSIEWKCHNIVAAICLFGFANVWDICSITQQTCRKCCNQHTQIFVL